MGSSIFRPDTAIPTGKANPQGIQRLPVITDVLIICVPAAFQIAAKHIIFIANFPPLVLSPKNMLQSRLLMQAFNFVDVTFAVMKR